MNHPRLFARLLLACAMAALVFPAHAQQPYPSKPIRIVTPYPPGGSTSVYAQLIAQRLHEAWGRQVPVDNRGGGNTLIGSEHVARSAPDGYTLMVITTTHVIVTQMIKAPYDPLKDFTPIATLGRSENILSVHKSLPVTNLKQFIAFAKARPGQLNFGTSGSGSVTHLAIELFQIEADIKMQQIPYKGSGPQLTAFLGGEIEVYLNAAVNLLPLIKTERVKALAITGDQRYPAVPNVPTFKEAGLPSFNAKGWFALIGPAGMPKPIVDKLSQEINRALAAPAFAERMRELGTDPFINTPEQFGELMKTDMARYAEVIKKANLKMN
jgi:tripartite-type tricarboxylate transporter receptor subunit TctC